MVTVMRFPMQLKYQKFALIDAKLTENGIANVYHGEKHSF